MITVYYDGQCGLCRREIDYYKRLAPEGAFVWVDITKDVSAFKELGLSTREGLRLLHVVDSKGVIHKGVDSFIVIWAALPHWAYLATIVRLPGIKWVTNLLYQRFANWRFKRLGYDTCDLP